jgi:hypothetical protein
MAGWLYLVIALGVTVVLAVGITLLLRGQVDRDADRQQPRWTKARDAAQVAAGGAAAVSSVPKKRDRTDSTPKSDDGPESG